MTLIADTSPAISLPQGGQDLEFDYKSEFRRGKRDFKRLLPDLRQRFPFVFPQDARAVRPLHHSVHTAIAELMGWSKVYARGVVLGHKMTAEYCRAVLRHDHRIGLDGKPVEGALVNDEDRNFARATLDSLDQRRKARREREKADHVLASGVPIPPPDPVPVVPPPMPPTVPVPVPGEENDPEPIPPPPLQ